MLHELQGHRLPDARVLSRIRRALSAVVQEESALYVESHPLQDGPLQSAHTTSCVCRTIHCLSVPGARIVLPERSGYGY